jgi:putative hydrolase of the HAD superfamily
VDDLDIQKALRVRFDYTKKELKPRADAIETLIKLKSKRLKIGLITDCSFEVPILWRKTPFSQYFDTTTFSCSVNMKKPDPRIYRITCDRLGVKPQSCLYIGDGSSQELTGASHVGMYPVLIRVPYENDAIRINEDDWKGQKITSLREVLNLVG